MASGEALLEGVEMPPRHRAYYASLRAETERALSRAREAKATLADSTPKIDALLALDLADRVSKMLDIDVAARLRGLLEEEGKERAALTIAREIALGAHMPAGSGTLERLDRAVRVGLATVTEGVTIAPLQGIAEVSLGKNRDGSEYLSLSIAGPMRSAGGTESAVTMLIADHVRQAAGLGRYRAASFDDEPGRFVEELRIYEREASNFQYRVTDEDIIKVISSLPVCLDGVDTDPYEVVNHKGMARIRTDRVRGGALRVLNDGLIGRSKKLLQRVERYGISGWEWLADLKGATPKRADGDDEDDTAASRRMREVITGRSVLSKAGALGGFRLRYGRACNTGFTSVGIHPAVAELLDHVVAVGTQVKTDVPGKGATVAFVDSIEAPVVRLAGGDVVRVRDAAHAASIRPSVEEILHLGDILVSFGDFVENGAAMPPSGYVEEWWAADLRASLGEGPAAEVLRGGRPSLARALEISRSAGVPLHPAHLHYWDSISAGELEALLSPESRGGGRVVYGAAAKGILERLAVPHRADGASCVLEGDEAAAFEALLLGARPDARAAGGVIEAITAASGVEVRPKFSTSVAVRVGRPEKAAARKMKPPAHLLFPVGDDGGPQRSLAKAAAAKAEFFADISSRTCVECGEASIAARCACGGQTRVPSRCPRCGEETDADECARCGRKAVSHAHRRFGLARGLAAAQERVRVRAREPLKGVRSLAGHGRVAEPIEKGLLRQAHGLEAFKDGTVRYEATNAPLTHFRPEWIGVAPSRLRELGYEADVEGRPLEGPSQLVEMFTQDAVIPTGAAEYLLGACKYIDAELGRLYGQAPYYNAKTTEDLVGQLVVGLAPHTSVGIVTRVIGFAPTHVCLGTPNWHSAKRRDADGDADALMMLLDVFLNFSREFLSDRIGGLMDAPLLVQPYVLPHEAQSQAHNLEVVKDLPLEFFEATLSGPRATDVKCVETVKSRLEAGGMYEGYAFTHATSSISTSRPRSAYSTLGSMDEKLEMQIRVADKINAVDTAEIVSNVISTHLVPDLVGNLRAYATQEFRCTKCGAKYRRVPLAGGCTGTAGGGRCANPLTATITRASVEKYLRMAARLVEKYDVGAYQRGRIRAMAREIEMVFGSAGGSQTVMGDYA